jgi:predicted metal-dependent phosphoesterase TrpH
LPPAPEILCYSAGDVNKSPALKADLHCHTHLSDGKHSPAFVIERARANQVTHLAMTDHDVSQALPEPASEHDPKLIAGVEISCLWESFEVHMVGLFVDPTNATLQTLLTQQQIRRHTRVAQIDAKLTALGTTGLLSDLVAKPAIALTRSHIADFLVANGVCKTRQKAFKTHLNRSGKLFVPAQWCCYTEAASAIKTAGGIPVLAHPGRYALNKAKLRRLVESFTAAGGEALEASYPNIAADMNQYLIQLAADNDLYLSTGSDFHDAAAQWTDVGKFPGLERTAAERGIWHHPVWVKDCGASEQ